MAVFTVDGSMVHTHTHTRASMESGGPAVSGGHRSPSWRAARHIAARPVRFTPDLGCAYSVFHT